MKQANHTLKTEVKRLHLSTLATGVDVDVLVGAQWTSVEFNPLHPPHTEKNSDVVELALGSSDLVWCYRKFNEQAATLTKCKGYSADHPRCCRNADSMIICSGVQYLPNREETESDENL